MPPKRKRTNADESITAQAASTSVTRTTRSASRNAGAAGQGSTSGASNSVATPSNDTPPAKKTRKSTKASKVSTGRGKGKAAQRHVVQDHLHLLVGPNPKFEFSADARTDAHQLPDDHDGTATSSVHTNGTATSKNASIPVKKPPPTKPKKAAGLAPQFEPYSSPSATSLFATYADPDDQDVIGPEGFEKLCGDAEISLEGAVPLVLAWQMGAAEMAKITKEEWEKSTADLKVSSLKTLSLAMHDLEDLLLLEKPAIKLPPVSSSLSRGSGSSTASFQLEPYNRSRYQEYAKDIKKAFGELYSFSFMLAKPPQGRNIDMETACAFWTVLVVPRYPLLKEVIQFITEKGTYKGVNKDLWSMMLEFCRTVSPNLEDYEADGAWPTLLDDFVSWKNGKTS